MAPLAADTIGLSELESDMAHCSIGQEQLGFEIGSRSASSLHELDGLIDWKPVAELLGPLYPATKGEPA